MPFYTDSDSLAPRIPPLGLPGMDTKLGGFLHFGVVVVAAGDDTGNSSDVHGTMPDTAPASTADTDADILLDSAETVDVFRVEASAANPIWVRDVAAQVVRLFNASVTIAVGDTNLAGGWIVAQSATTTDLTLMGDSDALTSDFYTAARGRVWAASSGHIGIAVVTDPTAGRLAVYAMYAQVYASGAA